MRFRIDKKGYCITEVDTYINSLNESLTEQRDRIAEQKNLIKELEKEVDSYRRKKDLIEQTVNAAKQKAAELEELSKKKYENEIAYLEQFHKKWLEYYAKLVKRHGGNEKEFNDKVSKLIASLKEADTETIYKNETKRLHSEMKSKTPAEPDEDKKPEEEFSLEEALHPTEDLKDIMKDLGIFEE